MSLISKLRRCYNLTMLSFRRATGKDCVASVADLMLMREDVDCNQILSASRYTDVVNFIENGDERFVQQNTISYANYGDRHDEKGGNEKFKQLILSFQKNGYNTDSQFAVDCHGRLLDGNHRMGLCLYLGIDEISVRCLRMKSKMRFGVQQYRQKGIADEIVDAWLKTFNEINEKFLSEGRCFVATFNNDTLFEKLSAYTSLQKNLIFDENGQKTYVVLFALKDPKYTCRNKALVSRTAEMLEEELRRIAPITISKNCLQGKQIYDSLNVKEATLL